MKKIIYMPTCILLLLAALVGCKKDAVVDGGLSNENVNMTTYDFLKNHNRQVFDTTLMIIDKAGMKDLINSSGTFFVPNDYAIANFIAVKQGEARIKSEKLNYTLDSLFKYFTPKMLRDSMGIYFIPQRITRDGLDDNGSIYPTSTMNSSALVALDVTFNDRYISGTITNSPQYMAFVKIIGDRDVRSGIGWAGWADPTGDRRKNDVRDRCQTTGIITTTGVVHVLSNSHAWTFKQLLP